MGARGVYREWAVARESGPRGTDSLAPQARVDLQNCSWTSERLVLDFCFRTTNSSSVCSGRLCHAQAANQSASSLRGHSASH